MYNHPVNDVKKFMDACGQTITGYNKEQADLYEKLIMEELQEFKDAKGDYGYHPIDDLDACGDLVWVIIGYAISMGYDFEGAFREIARSNMSKVDPETGKVIKRDDGKILKPDTFSEPKLGAYIG